MSETALKSSSWRRWANLKGVFRSDVLFAGAIIAILALLILPTPRWLLDILLAASITFSVTILMTALFTRRALDFSTFPAILLIATMLRLGLNIASTRLILSKGHEGADAAGRIIEAFGGFVMQGNYVIGMIVFAILVIVNFVVITRGSGRIAEVAARFSLDAMPGKQMAIDADLSSGIISEDEARTRRKTLEDESNFFGAMDGASKFVRGDAIAGLLITLINIIGGVIIGVAQMNMSLGDAGASYTLLTIGDGLVSQIPALIVSISAGLLVSKAGVEETADKALAAQLGEYPKALAIVAAVLITMAVLPGMPFVPFATLAFGTGAGAFAVTRRKTALAAEAAKADRAKAPALDEDLGRMLAIDDLRIEIGYGLLALVNAEPGPRLTDQVKAVRRAIAQELGFVTPPVRILDNMQLAPNAYVIRLKEQEIARGELRPGRFLVMDPAGKPITLAGEPAKEPAFGLDAMWIDQSQREEASLKGFTVVDAATVLTTHLTEIIKTEASTLLSYAETRKLIDALPDKHRQLVSDLVPSIASVTTIQRVLQALLGEKVSIRDLPTILEAIAEAAPQSKDTSYLVEHVRARLARQLCGAIPSADGAAPIVTLSSQWEGEFADALTGEKERRQLAMAPSKLQEFVAAALAKLEKAAEDGDAAAIVTTAGARPFVRSVIERVRPQTMVLSQNEIHPHTRLKNLGQI